jgi:tetratricopeptide (TPR) repeat protein
MKTLFTKPVLWATRFRRAAFWILLGTLAITPLVYFPFTFEAFELPKQSVLIVGISLAWLAMLAADLLKPVSKTRQHLASCAFRLFLLVLVVSCLISDAPYRSWIGQSGLEAQSFLSFFYYGLTFWLGVRLWKRHADRFEVVLWVLVSAVVVGLIGVLSLIFSESDVFFNTIGTANSFALYLIVMTLLGFGCIAGKTCARWKRWVFRVAYTLLPLLTVFVLLVLDYVTLWSVLLVGIGSLVFFSFWTKQEGVRLIYPLFVGVIGIVFFAWAPNPFPLSVASEVTPSIGTSWTVLEGTLAEESVLFGSGLATYPLDYAMHRPVEINQSLLWETRFQNGYSFVFDLVTTTGVIGFAAFLLFLFLIKIQLGTKMWQDRTNTAVVQSGFVMPAWGALFMALCLFPANLSLLISLMFTSALLASVWAKDEKNKQKNVTVRTRVFVSIGAIVLIGCMIMSGQRVVADTIYAQGLVLDQQGASFEDVLSKLDHAAYLNRLHDGYYRTLANAFLIQAINQIEQRDGELSSSERMYTQSFLNAAKNAAEHAIMLSPKQGLNWSVLGSLYQSFFPYSVSEIASAELAFDRLLFMEPANPAAWEQYGDLYLDAAKYNEPNKEVWLVAAEKKYAQALSLKPDYGQAGYKLANVYLAQGRTDAAIEMMSALHQTYPSDVTVVFELGMLYLERGQEGDLDLAGEAFANAITLVPTYANAYWYLASVYEGKGMIEQAIVEVERVLIIDPENEAALARLEQLQKGVLAEELPLLISQ